MSFKYMNPGYAELLDVAGGTTVAGSQYGKFGVAFYQTNNAKGLDFTAKPTEIYGRFDVYPAEKINSDTNVYVAMPSLNGNIRYGHGVRLYFYSQQKSKGEAANGTIYGLHGMSQPIYTSMTDYFKIGVINTVWFHVTQNDGTNTNKITMRVNGKPVAESSTSGSSFYDVLTFGIASTTPDVLLSNIIISDEEIDPGETLALLPVSATEATMTAQGDGSYVASAAGQTILQSVDVQSLADEYGADSVVKGIALVGKPAYRTGAALTKLVGIQKANGAITEYGVKTLTENNTDGIIDGRSVSMVLSDLAGKQFGWRASAN